MKCINMLLLSLLFVAGTAIGQQLVQPDSIRLAAWQEFRAEQGNEWSIRWSETTGLPVSLYSGRTKPYPGTYEEAARVFLEEHQTLFGFTDTEQLEYTQTRVNRDIRYVTFYQKVEEVPVYKASYRVQVRPDGRIIMANGIYHPDIDVSTDPLIQEAEAVRIARRELNIPPEQELDVTPELVIYPGPEDYHLGWRLILFSKEPLTDWEFIVDAHDGMKLFRYNRLTHAIGSGNVYPTHPGLSSVTTESVYRLNGNGYLEGTYVDVENDETSNAFSANHDFQYSTSSTHFDEVNLYYHVDDFRHNYIEGLNSAGNYSLEFTHYNRSCSCSSSSSAHPG